MPLLASVDGDAAVRARPQAFIAAFVRRVETGLLVGAPRRRNRYVVTRHGIDGLAFRAADWLTAINVGLNDVDLAVSPDGRLRYGIRYSRWSGYVLFLGASLGVVFISCLLLLDVRGYIAQHATLGFSRLSVEQNIAVAWAMAVFWGFAWPWILILLHRRPLRRLIEKVIAEVDAVATTSYE